MANNNTINVYNPDFDGLKTSIKEYLSSQTKFQDYNFEGSALSILIDIFSYQISNQIFYLNMVGSESFLDSAQLRESVVSHAKSIGYVPTSKTSARANLSVSFSPDDNPNGILIPSGFKFTSEIDGSTYIFSTSQDYYVSKDSEGNYNYSGIEIVEGTRLTHRFTVDSSNQYQRFIIPNTNIDTSTIKVSIQNSSVDSTLNVYKKAIDILVLSATDKVFFVQEIANEQHEIYFGKDLIGKQPENGNIVIVEYVVSNGELGNDAEVFVPEYSIGGYSGTVYTTIDNSSGGAEIESIDEIKSLAPPSYQAQNRCVTTRDYETIILNNFQFAEAVKVWGGEDDDEPKFGSVLISIKPVDNYTLTESTKTYIINNILKPRKLLAITPEFVDPDYIYLQIYPEIDFDSTKTDDTESTIKANIISTINSYETNYLNKFDSGFILSKLSKNIDDSHVSIVGNETTIKLRKRIYPTLNQGLYYEIDYSNKIDKADINNDVRTLSSTGFVYNGFDCYLRDDGEGNIQIYRYASTQKIIVKNIGTIDYENGIVNLNKFSPSSILNDKTYIDIMVIPYSNNIYSVRNQILTIDSDDISVTMVNINN